MLELKGSAILEGDALGVLKTLPAGSIRCVVTSPPYWGQRDYGFRGQTGGEESLPRFIGGLARVFEEVRRVLTPDGTLWLNMGDGYTSGGRAYRDPDKMNPARGMGYRPDTPAGLKAKDLLGLPWRLAFALQERGWYLRTDVVWHKPNAMPESVKDRPGRAHEFLFMLTKSEKYLYNHEAVKEAGANGGLRNRRTVWRVNTRGFRGAHFATFPPELITPCILASSLPGDYVLDPFFGAGTTGIVAEENRRRYIGIEISPKYIEIARERLG